MVITNLILKGVITLYLSRFKYIPLIGTLKNYKKEYFSKDMIAALTVAVVAIPQSDGLCTDCGC